MTEQELKVIIETIEGEGCWKNRRATWSNLLWNLMKSMPRGYYPRVDMIAVDIDDPIEETIKR